MDFCGGRDVLDRMTWTIFDDRESFDGADAAAIRRHFREWAEGAVRSEQPSGAGMGRSPRYRYCLQVDAAALGSVVHDGPAVADDFDPYRDRQGWVKVIDKNWLPRSENPIWAGRPPDPNTYEPIDGCTDENVGWVLCPTMSVLTEYYMHFQDVNAYTRSYRRPPDVVGYPWN